jgi:signal transduction histidine kinase
VPGDDRWVDADGRALTGGASGHPVVLSDEAGPVLRLRVAGRVDQGDVLAALTPAVRLALRNAALAAVGRARLADVRASQQRVVAAADAERRRIERDLHDGAQQRLVGVALHLAIARPVVDEPAAAQLRAAEDWVRDALTALRRLAHGTFPAVLSDEGLAAALEELAVAAERPVSLDLRIHDTDLDGHAAMAAYACVAAALDELGRDPEPGPVTVTVVRQPGSPTLTAEVAAGGRCPRTPALADVADRVSALGGQLKVADTAGSVLWLQAVIPCGS